jgi:hypothetical protein
MRTLTEGTCIGVPWEINIIALVVLQKANKVFLSKTTDSTMKAATEMTDLEEQTAN